MKRRTLSLAARKKCEWRERIDGEQDIGESFFGMGYPWGYCSNEETEFSAVQGEYVVDLTPDEIQTALAGLYAIAEGVG